MRAFRAAECMPSLAPACCALLPGGLSGVPTNAQRGYLQYPGSGAKILLAEESALKPHSSLSIFWKLATGGGP